MNTLTLYSQNNSDLKTKEMYDNLYPKEAERNALSGNYLDLGFVQTLTEGWGTLVASYVNLYKATKDKAYLIKAINYCLVIEYNRQDIQYPSDPSNKCWTYAGMINPDKPGESQANIMHKNGRALWGLSEFVYLVKHDNDLYYTLIPQNLIDNPFSVTFTTYGDFAEWLQDRILETFDFIIPYYWGYHAIEWDNDGENKMGFLNYNQSSMCINMQATFAAALTLMGILIANDGDQPTGQSYIDKAITVVDLFKNYPLKIHNNGGSCNGYDYDNCDTIIYPLMNNDDASSYYWFDNGWRTSRANWDCWAHRMQCTDLYDDMEDITHAVYTLTLPLTLTDYYSQYSPIDASQMVKFRNAFTKHVYYTENGIGKYWSSVQGNDNIHLDQKQKCKDYAANATPQECTKYSAFGWMPLYKYDELAGNEPNVYNILMDLYRNTLNTITDVSDVEYDRFFYYPLQVNYYGLSEVVKAQWEKECPDLTLRNRDVVYDQDFYSKNDLIVDASLTNPFDPVNVNSSFADPVITNPEFIIEQNVSCNMTASNKIVIKPGFHAKAGCNFHAYIDEINCSGSGQKILSPQYNPPPPVVTPLNKNNITKTDSVYFNLTPNPCKTFVQIEYSTNNDKDVIMEIYNIAGNKLKQHIYRGRKNIETLDISELTNGIYTYRVYSGDKLIKANKIVVIK